MFTTFLVFHLVNFLLSNITGFSLFTRHSVDQLSASPLTSPFSIYSLPDQPISPMLSFPRPVSHFHPTGPQPDKHPAPLPHVIQGHGKSVLTHHLHVTVDMRDF